MIDRLFAFLQLGVSRAVGVLFTPNHGIVTITTVNVCGFSYYISQNAAYSLCRDDVLSISELFSSSKLTLPIRIVSVVYNAVGYSAVFFLAFTSNLLTEYAVGKKDVYHTTRVRYIQTGNTKR